MQMRDSFLREEMGPWGDLHKSLNYTAFSEVSSILNYCGLQGDSTDGVSGSPALLHWQTKQEQSVGERKPRSLSSAHVTLWDMQRIVCVRVQVHPLPVARSTSAPFSYPLVLTWGSPSAFQELLLSFNRQLMQANYRSLGPLGRRAEGCKRHQLQGQEPHEDRKELGLVK